MSKLTSSLAEQVHGSCVSINGCGVLMIGASGSGKSDICLRLIDTGAELVADDRVILEKSTEGILTARAPERLQGMLEVRGLGVMHMVCVPLCPVGFAVENSASPERLPEDVTASYLGVELPLLRLNLLHASSCAKIRLWIAQHLARQLKTRHAASL